jgi:hypothetical protein
MEWNKSTSDLGWLSRFSVVEGLVKIVGTAGKVNTFIVLIEVQVWVVDLPNMSLEK